MAEPLFSMKDISFVYGHHFILFRGFNAAINAGESLCVLGANGSGKTTLLKMLCALVFPASGEFRAFGRVITEEAMENDYFAKEYHRRIGFVFQNADVQLFTTRVWDEIAFGPLQMGFGEEEVEQRVRDVAALLQIEDLLDRTPYRLSGGEKKKVAFATVLVMNPEVLIMDEPTNGLDPKTQRWLTDILLQLNRAGRTVITATHNLELAHTVSRRALVLSENHCLVYDGPTHSVLKDRDMLMEVNLIDEYCHIHDHQPHTHRYTHG